MFQKCMAEAEKGKNIIETYYGRHTDNGKHRTVMLIFPDDDHRMLFPAFRYLNRFLEVYYYDVAVILSSIELPDCAFTVHTSKYLYFYDLNRSDMDAVLRFVSLLGCPHTRVLSFRKPSHIYTEDLIGFKDITADKLTYTCLFGMFGKDV